MTADNNSNDEGMTEKRRRDEVFDLQRTLQHTRKSTDAVVGVIVSSSILESLVVPAMRDVLKTTDEQYLRRLNKEKQAEHKHNQNNNDINNNRSSTQDEKKDHDDNGTKKVDNDDAVAYTIAILECMVAFMTTNNKTASSSSSSSNTPKALKAIFFASGAYEMMMHLLGQILDEHGQRASSKSWTSAKTDGIDAEVGIGIDFDYLDQEHCCDLRIISTVPKNSIPVLILKVIAVLAHRASDAMKNDRLLPFLTHIIHQAMMVYLPCEDIQKYGCWTLQSLSNPLLQELIAAGSFSLLVQAMKCYPSNPDIQEYGNKALYNLLPLLVHFSMTTTTNGTDSVLPPTKPQTMMNTTLKRTSNSMRSPVVGKNWRDTPARKSSSNNPTSTSIEIDGQQLEDYEQLLPNLPEIVLRGMDFHPCQLGVQQYGLCVLMRLCQHDSETFEVIVSEGGLTSLLMILQMTTPTAAEVATTTSPITSNDTATDSAINDDDDHRSLTEKHDSLAQMACQFLKDLSRPSNSSMDILRIIAVKGGIQTVLKVLDHYNTQHSQHISSMEHQQQQEINNNSVSSFHSRNSTTSTSTTINNSSVINIIDPAMACLRNLMVHEDNRTEAIMISLAISTKEAGDGIICVTLRTMDLFPHDAAIQAYGCDLLGRLATHEELARIELIQTTIFNETTSNDIHQYKQQKSPGGHELLTTPTKLDRTTTSRTTSPNTNNNRSTTQLQEQQKTTPRSRLWNRSSSNTSASPESASSLTDSNNDGVDINKDTVSTNEEEDGEVMNVSDQFNSSGSGSSSAIMAGISHDSVDSCNSSSSNTKRNNIGTSNVDSFMTLIRAMKIHRTHHGVQERSIILLLALIVDKDDKLNNCPAGVNSSSYLIQRLQEVYYIQLLHDEDQQQEHDTPTLDFLSFLKSTPVSSKGTDRLKQLITIVEQYERLKRRHGINPHLSMSNDGSSPSATATTTTPVKMVTNLFRGWAGIGGSR